MLLTLKLPDCLTEGSNPAKASNFVAELDVYKRQILYKVLYENNNNKKEINIKSYNINYIYNNDMLFLYITRYRCV